MAPVHQPDAARPDGQAGRVEESEFHQRRRWLWTGGRRWLRRVVYYCGRGHCLLPRVGQEELPHDGRGKVLAAHRNGPAGHQGDVRDVQQDGEGGAERKVGLRKEEKVIGPFVIE